MHFGALWFVVGEERDWGGGRKGKGGKIWKGRGWVSEIFM